ncbi:MAG: short-chain fatty acid transporter [Myxococcota bacterium]
MIRWLGRKLSAFAGRWVPDPFAIAILLTILAIGLAWLGTGLSPLELLGYWGGRLKGDEVLDRERGLWKLLAFGMQMCLILVTGHALASSRPVHRLIDRVAGLPRTSGQAIALTAVVAMCAALVNWGLGLIVGALMAREVAVAARHRGLRVHYPLLGAAGYTAMMVWHGGLSGSAPLTVTQAKDLASILDRPDVAPITLGETLFSPMNITVTLALLVAVPTLLVMMQPRREEDFVEVDPGVLPGPAEADPRSEHPTPAERLERSRLLAWTLAAFAAAYLVMYLGRLGADRVDLNAINLTFLALGLLLHGSPRAYGRAIAAGTRGCAGIILQFPLYAGIMGIIALAGLVEQWAEVISRAANEWTFAPLTMGAAGAVNLLVPSGGGQWAIQGPLVLSTAESLDIPFGKAVMAFAYGDGWTNMLQPFWALPLLGITGLAARDLVGYTAALMLLVLPVYLVGFMVF